MSPRFIKCVLAVEKSTSNPPPPNRGNENLEEQNWRQKYIVQITGTLLPLPCRCSIWIASPYGPLQPMSPCRMSFTLHTDLTIAHQPLGCRPTQWYHQSVIELLWILLVTEKSRMQTSLPIHIFAMGWLHGMDTHRVLIGCVAYQKGEALGQRATLTHWTPVQLPPEMVRPSAEPYFAYCLKH